jgi:hypothetical protein
VLVIESCVQCGHLHAQAANADIWVERECMLNGGLGPFHISLPRSRLPTRLQVRRSRGRRPAQRTCLFLTAHSMLCTASWAFNSFCCTARDASRAGGRRPRGIHGVAGHPIQSRFSALAEVLARHVNTDAAGIMRAPFALAEAEQVRAMLAEQGFCDITIESVAGSVCFPSVSRFVPDYVRGSPLASRVAKVSDETRMAIVNEVGDALTPYVAGEGFRSKRISPARESEHGGCRTKVSRLAWANARDGSEDIQPKPHQVCSGSKADISVTCTQVRFGPTGGHRTPCKHSGNRCILLFESCHRGVPKSLGIATGSAGAVGRRRSFIIHS